MIQKKLKKSISGASDGSENFDSARPSSEYWLKKDDEDIRMYAAITFAFLLIVVGVPLWWKTTEVYRVHVPYGRIDDLKDMDITFPVIVTILSKDDSRSNSAIQYLRNSTLSTNGLVSVTFRVGSLDIDKYLTAPSLQDLDLLDLLPNKPGHIYLLEVPGMLRFSTKTVVVGTKRIIYFSREADNKLLEDVLNLWFTQTAALYHTRSVIESPNESKGNKIGRRRMPPSSQYELMFSIVHPEPERRVIIWDVQKAVEDHLSKLTEAISPVASIWVKSQWLYLVRLESRPRQMQNGESVWYSLPEDVLPHLITPLEKKLGSGVGEHPTIQLVLYIPPCQMSPLLITSKANVPPSTSFLSPRWGAVQIYNPPPESCGNVDERMKSRSPHALNSSLVMTSFKTHLKLLMGVPELIKIDGIEQLPLPENGIRDWELDSLMRFRALEHLLSAKVTLKSLAQLLDEISNIVITDEVGSLIWDAISKSHESVNFISKGDLHAGFRASKEAFLAAETAFSDRSLLALLYFPDDQKYAVYIPLFLPVMIPVLMSLKSIRTWWVTGTTHSVEEKEKNE